MSRRRHAPVLDLTPGRLDLCLYHGTTNRLSVFRRDGEGVVLSMAGWTDQQAVFRLTRGGPEVVDLLPALNGDQIDIIVSEAMKSALGAGYVEGVWEVDITDDVGDAITLVHGDVTILPEVVTV